MTNTFKEGLSTDRFQVLARVNPPKSGDLSSAVALASSFKGKVDAVVVGDNSSAIMGVSSLVLSERLKREGHDVILTVSCRDCNRMALGSTVLGAAAIGVDSILCVSGDYFNFGDHRDAKPVYDLDSVQLLGMIREMQDGRDTAGNPIDGPLSFATGAVVRAIDDDLEPHIMKAKKKVSAGARFLVTLPIFAAEELEALLEGLTDVQAKIIAGVFLPSYDQIESYGAKPIAGTLIPDDLAKSWKDAGPEGFNAASADLARKLISDLRSSGKVAGVCVGTTGRNSEIAALL